MDDDERGSEPQGTQNIWLTVVAPLVVGGLTTPFIPNAVFWIAGLYLPEQFLATAWERFGFYIAAVRACGVAILVTAAWVSVREIVTIKEPIQNSDMTSGRPAVPTRP